MAPDFSALQPALLFLVFAALALMSAGFLWKDRRAHLLRSAGWILFGLYWPFQSPEFFFGPEPDPINGWFTLLGPLFLFWIAWHEFKSYQWDEDPAALRWFTGASVIASVTYFIIYELPSVQLWMMTETAKQSAWMYNTVFFGGEHRAFVVVDPIRNEPDIRLPGGVYAVTVILACTAIQSIMIFVGAIACLKADTKRKWKGYLMTVPTIYVLNLFRNAGIIYGYKDLNWRMFGLDSFEWMHSYVGKVGSLVAMIIIALGLFSALPELHHNILDLFDLHKRRAAGFFNRPPPPPRQHAEPPAKPTDI